MELGAAPASRPGLLPPLGQEGAQGLPAAPGDGGAEAAKSGKKKKVKKKLGKKKVVNDVLLLRSKAKEEDDTSDKDPRLSEERRAARRSKKREAKDEEEHRSIKDSSSSSEDMRAELFRDAASSGSLVNKIQRVAQESPGALLDSGLKGCSRPETIGKDTSLLPSCQTRGQSWEKKEMPSEAGSGQGISCRATCRSDG